MLTRKVRFEDLKPVLVFGGDMIGLGCRATCTVLSFHLRLARTKAPA